MPFSGCEFPESLEQSDSTFKPGWKDIFRMNQNELESEIRKVSRDSSLDPRRKAYLIQNLMTRFVFNKSIFLNLYDCYIIVIIPRNLLSICCSVAG